jgi:hypothetical protein
MLDERDCRLGRGTEKGERGRSVYVSKEGIWRERVEGLIKSDHNYA